MRRHDPRLATVQGALCPNPHNPHAQPPHVCCLLAQVGLLALGPGQPAAAPLSLRSLFLDRLALSPPPGCGGAPGSSGGGDSPAAGEYLVLAELWPAQRLARGTAAPARALADALGRPGPGAQLAVYPLPQQAQQAQQEEAECSAVYLRLCSTRGAFAAAPAVLPPAEDGAAAAAAAAAGPPASPTPGRGSAGGSAPAALSPAMRGGGGTPVALSPAMRGAGGRPPVALSPAMRGSGAGGAVPVGLQGARGRQPAPPGTPKTPASGSRSSEEGGSNEEGAPAAPSIASSGGGSREAVAAVQPGGLQAAALLTLLQSGEPGGQRAGLRTRLVLPTRLCKLPAAGRTL